MSKSLKKLQEKIGSHPDGSFGPNTAKAPGNLLSNIVSIQRK